MDFLLTETQSKLVINNLMTSFANQYINPNNVRRVDSFILISNDSGDDYFENLNPFFEFDYYDGRLYVNDVIWDNFQSIFGTNTVSTNDFFKKWFGHKFKVDVKFVEK